jgi:arylsulfatase A-like enzyme
MSWRRFLALVGAAIASGALGCGSPRAPGDVVLITVDALRADHLGLYGYERPTTPNLDRWFADAAIFERAYSTEANTSPSVVSLLSGRLPPEHRIRLLYQLVPDELKLLTDYLPASFQTAGFVANVVLTDEAMGIAHRFDHYDDYVDELVSARVFRVYERNAHRHTDAVLSWLREECDPTRPLFLWVHFIDPHQPYAAPDGAPVFGPEEAAPRPAATRRRANRRGRVDDYDSEIAFMDAEVGRLLDGYSALRPSDDALVVFTADHAESMMEHELWFTHGYQVYDEIVRVPLMVRGPGVRAGRYERLASGVDIAPTVLGFLGLAAPTGWSGFDLRRGDRIPANRTVFAEASGRYRSWRAGIQGTGKWMVSTRPGQREIVETRFYELASDPAELRALPWEEGPLPERLREMVLDDPDPGGRPPEVKRGRRMRAPKVSPRATPEQLERLRVMGYVE